MRAGHHLPRRRRGRHGRGPAPRHGGDGHPARWRRSRRRGGRWRTSAWPTRSTSWWRAASATAATSPSASRSGAKAVAIGHSALMALNCNKEIPGVTDYMGSMGVPAGECYHCHTGRCPVGITTQDPELRKRLRGRRGRRAGLQLPPHAHARGAADRARVREDEHPLARAGGPRGADGGGGGDGQGAADGHGLHPGRVARSARWRGSSGCSSSTSSTRSTTSWPSRRRVARRRHGEAPA